MKQLNILDPITCQQLTSYIWYKSQGPAFIIDKLDVDAYFTDI